MSTTTSEPRRRPGISRPFWTFAAVNGLSVFGDFVTFVAFSLFAFATTHSALLTGLLLALRLGAGLAAAPGVGQLATHRSRRVLLAAAEGAQAVVLGALALAVGSDALAVPLLFATAILTGVAGTATSVGLRASIPAMVGPDERMRANGILVTTRSIATMAGFASAGVIVATAGYAAAFAVDAATFLVSAAMIAWLPLPLREPAGEEPASGAPTRDSPAGERKRSARRALGQLRASAATHGVLGAIAIRTLDAAGSGAHNVALPVFFGETQPHNAARFYAGFWLAWAAGSMLASTLARRWMKRTARQPDFRAFALGTCAMSATFTAVFVGWPFPLLLLLALLAGCADGFTEITYTTRLQAAPDDERGRVFAVSAVGENGGLGSGMLTAALLLPLLGALPTVGLLHGAAIVAALALLVSRRAT
jgi:MFS family permease